MARRPHPPASAQRARTPTRVPHAPPPSSARADERPSSSRHQRGAPSAPPSAQKARRQARPLLRRGRYNIKPDDQHSAVLSSDAPKPAVSVLLSSNARRLLRLLGGLATSKGGRHPSLPSWLLDRDCDPPRVRITLFLGRNAHGDPEREYSHSPRGPLTSKGGPGGQSTKPENLLRWTLFFCTFIFPFNNLPAGHRLQGCIVPLGTTLRVKGQTAPADHTIV